MSKEEEESRLPRQPLLPRSTEDDVPWVVVGFRDQTQILYSKSNPMKIRHCQIPQFRDNHIIGHSNYGWLILRSRIEENTSMNFSLLNPLSLETIPLPTLIDSTGGFWRGQLTSPPADPDCRVILAHDKNPQLAHCKPGGGVDNTWTVHEFAQDSGSFRNLAVCKGSLYAITAKHNLVEIATDNNNNNSLVPSLVVGKVALHLPYTIKTNSCNLVESDGELLRIIVCCRGFSNNELEFVLVYKLDKSSKGWVQVHTLNGRAIFVCPTYSFSCSPNSKGTKPNCIYLVLGDKDKRRILVDFDVERGQSSQCPLHVPSGNFAFFNYTTYRSLIDDKKKSGIEEAEETQIVGDELQVQVHNQTTKVEEAALILKLPWDIFTSVATKLVDYRNFRNCCKTLKSAIPLQPPSYPWIFYFKHYKGTLNFQDSMYGQHRHEKQAPESLSGAYIISSKESWLVMEAEKRIPNPYQDPWFITLRHQITFYNPFTNEVHTIPEMMPLLCPTSFGISAPPTSSDCCIIAMCEGGQRGALFNFMRMDDQHWHFYLQTNDKDFIPSYHNTPVSLGSRFYFLGKGRRLGVVSYGRGDGGGLKWTWDVYDWKLQGKAGEPIEDPSYDDYGFELEYLVICGGKILAVLVGDFGKLVRLYKFDQEQKGWLEVENLGSHMIFIGTKSCFSTMEKIAGMGNKIYFPRVSRKQNIIFYSLDTRKYHTFGFEDVMVDFQYSSEVHLCGWIDPS